LIQVLLLGFMMIEVEKYPSNEIKYIGKTKNLKDRLNRHMNPCNLKDSWTSKNKWLLLMKNLKIIKYIIILTGFII